MTPYKFASEVELLLPLLMLLWLSLVSQVFTSLLNYTSGHKEFKIHQLKKSQYSWLDMVLEHHLLQCLPNLEEVFIPKQLM